MKMHDQTHSAARLIVALGFAAACAGASAQEAPVLDVIYVPTPQPVVDKMLEMAKVGKNDVVYDLGSGDGRIVVTAAKARGARGLGVDIDPARVAEANANAKAAGVQDRVQFRTGDLYELDIKPATVVTMYLLPEINRNLRPKLWRDLAVGTRVVSHAFDMGKEWPPERTETVQDKVIYYWTINANHKKQIAAADKAAPSEARNAARPPKPVPPAGAE